MKIDPIQNINTLKAYRAGKAKYIKPSQTPLNNDKADISEDALAFSKALSALRESDNKAGTEPKRLEDIKNRVDNGEYNVEGSLVAAKILAMLNNGE